MEIKIIEIRELKAGDGMVLTNGQTFSDPGEKIYLGINDNPDNWYEITEEEAAERQKEMENLEEFE